MEGLMTKEEIRTKLQAMRAENSKISLECNESVSVERYIDFVRTDKNGTKIWTEALQKAIDENNLEIVVPMSGCLFFGNDKCFF